MEKFSLIFLLLFSWSATATVIELFTSQGCSSCPPAEEWIGKLRGHPEFMKELIPMVWHVDYWDGLGWKDTLARPEYTQRQRRYSAAWKKDQVYTPGLVVDGSEKRNWREVSLKPSATSKSLMVKRVGTQITVDHKALKTQTLWMAIVSDSPGISIEKGENAGRKSSQDFVVTSLQKGALKNGLFIWKIPKSKGHAVVWLEEEGDPTPRRASAVKLEDLN